MSHEHKVALEKILNLTSKARTPTNRLENILDISLAALGYVRSQREAYIKDWRELKIQTHRDKMEEWKAK